MANTSFNFNIDPYYDDFEATNGPREQNYMRILFRPGNAVQARELTQLQTILQNQIKQFGNHVFQDGSPVQGGHLTLDVSVKSIKLQPQYANTDINLSDFADELIKSTTAGNPVRAQIVATDSTQVRPTIMVKYLSGNEFSNNQELELVSDNTKKALTDGSGAIANGSVVSINEGVFYVDGYFVYVEAQTIILDPYNDKPSARVGLQIIDKIVDERTDASLLDPAQGSFNYQAPGAVRYQFRLELTKRTLTSTDDTKFFELLRVENGIVTKQVRYPIYSELEKTLARRTYDESGHYTVKPFRVSASANTNPSTTFKLDIEPGKAYVKGFEFETLGTVSMIVDKALTKNTSTNYSFSLDYGSYVVASNVYSGGAGGFLGINATTEVDLHAVPSGQIVTNAGLATYANTKIGTARIRNIDFAGTDTVSGDNYYVYLFDINTTPKTVIAPQNSSNTNAFTLPSTFSAVNDAYKNVKMRITAGKATDSYTRTITSYDGTTRTAFVDKPFSSSPGTTSQITLLYSIEDVDSMVIAPPAYTANYYYTQDLSTLSRTCMDISFDGKTVGGKTILYDTDRNKLYYTLPQSHVSEDAFTDVEYFRKANTTVAFTGGVSAAVPLQSGGTWFFGNSITLSPLVAKQNFIVINRDTGAAIDFSDTAGNSITQASESTLTITANGQPSTSFVADVITTERVLSTTAGYSVGTKSLITPSETLQSYDSFTTASGVMGTSNGVKINTSVGHVWYTNSSYITNTPGVAKSLYITDVVRIVKVFESGNIAYAPNTTNAVDITNRFILDGGQRDNYYDYATITLKDGYAAPSGQTVVFLEYFDQVGNTFFAPSSYTSVYANNKIPNFVTADGIISLRDAVDFRPKRKSALTNDPAVFALEGSSIPSPEYTFEATYQYYVPRVDKLVLTKDREFKLLKGIPSVFPQEPKVSDDDMVLYKINVPAYTSRLQEVGIEYIENKRYTMRDIGNIEKRVENLEYYTSLNVLELQAKNEPVLYEDNISEKEKYGIVVDEFSNFAIADTRSADFRSNISRARLGPYRFMKPLSLVLVSSANAKINDKTISLDYSEEACITQGAATKGITVQPYEFAQFHGSVSLFPESDYWYSTLLKPEVIQINNPELPGKDQIQPAPALPAPTVVEPAPVVGEPVNNPPPQEIIPPDGFGIVEPITNWFGGFSIGGGGVNSIFNVFDPIINSGFDRK